MSDSNGSPLDAAAATWGAFKEEQPEVAAVLSILPVTGQVAAAAEYYKAMKEGNAEDAALAALSFIPGGAIKGIKMLKEARETDAWAKRLQAVAAQTLGSSDRSQRAAVRLADMSGAARGEAVSLARRGAGGVAADASNLTDYLNSKFNEGFSR